MTRDPATPGRRPLATRRGRAWAIAAAALLVASSPIIFEPSAAGADEAPAAETGAPSVPAVPAAGVHWRDDWPRFRWWEYLGSAAVGASSWYLRHDRPPPSQAKWQGTNWFDDAFRGWLRADTAAGRLRAQHASDRLTEIGYIVPFAIDLPVAAAVHREPRLAWQLLMMNLEAFAVSGFINNFLFYQVGRARPSARDCAADPSYDPLCGVGANASLPSGHTLTMATGAGLTCVHHRYLPLYGNEVADGGACGFMLLATIATAATRIMADRHYATDDLMGIAIGFGSGYGLPWLLHYRGGAREPGAAGRPEPPSVAFVPFGGNGAYGAGVTALF